MPKGYTRTQIVLHWLIFAMLIGMILNEDAIGEAFRAYMRSGTFTQTPLVAAHVFGGLAILALVVVRFAIKARRGAPPLPENEPALLKLAAHGTHLALYAILFLMPISGAVAWFGAQGWAAEVHEIFKPLLILLVTIHVAGALYQQFVLKTDVMNRMRKPE